MQTRAMHNVVKDTLLLTPFLTWGVAGLGASQGLVCTNTLMCVDFHAEVRTVCFQGLDEKCPESFAN